MSICNNPKFKMYTGLVEQFEYCESCGEKKAGHSKSAIVTASITISNEQLALPTGSNFWNGGISPQNLPTSCSTFYNWCPPNPSPRQVGQSYLPIKSPSPQGRSISFPIAPPSTAVYPPGFFIPASNKQVPFPPKIWIDYEANTNPILYGVDRSVDRIRLAGVSTFQPPSDTHQESLVQLAVLIAREGGRSTDYFLHPEDWRALFLEIFPGHNVSGNFFQFNTAFANITVLQDSTCPKGYGYLLQKSTWINDPLHGAYCTQPGYNGVLKLL